MQHVIAMSERVAYGGPASAGEEEHPRYSTSQRIRSEMLREGTDLSLNRNEGGWKTSSMLLQVIQLRIDASLA
jgi:hypothetical protein